MNDKQTEWLLVAAGITLMLILAAILVSVWPYYSVATLDTRTVITSDRGTPQHSASRTHK